MIDVLYEGLSWYLLRRSAREAEKIHRAQEREMHKKGSDRITKESFKTKKDLDDASSTKQQGEVRSENTPGEKTEVKETEKSLVETKEGGIETIILPISLGRLVHSGKIQDSPVEILIFPNHYNIDLEKNRSRNPNGPTYDLSSLP